MAQLDRPVRDVWPGRQWQTVDPAQVGLEAAGLEAFAQRVGGRGCVVRAGRMAYAWGDIRLRADIASAGKPIYAHFLWRALEDGRIGHLDEPVARYEPRLALINAQLGHKDRQITWRHLANQTACYGVAEPPGAAYDYNDWQMALFWDCLFTRVYGATLENVDERVLRPLLADPLGCADSPTLLAFGPHDRPGRVGISVRDFARFGLLYLRGGEWTGRQLIRPEHVRMATTSPVPSAIPRTCAAPAEMIPGQRSIGSKRVPDDQTDHYGSYSWLWWTNGVSREGVRMWPDVPVDACCASGHGGKRALVVIPSLDIVVSWNDAAIEQVEPGPQSPQNQALRLLVQAAEKG